MLGTLVNVGAIILGSLLGLSFKKGIKDSVQATLMDGLGLSVMVIGIIGSIKAQNIILMILSLVIGALIGEWIDIDSRLETLGNKLQGIAGKGDQNISKGFVTASLVYCVGAMAIVGSLESGIQGNHETLFAKSVLDGISAIVFSSSLGIGVLFSSIPVLIYQGGMTLFANIIKDFLSPELINELSALGSVLILAIGINILGLKKIKVANLLPAMMIPVAYFVVLGLI